MKDVIYKSGKAEFILILSPIASESCSVGMPGFLTATMKKPGRCSGKKQNRIFFLT